MGQGRDGVEGECEKQRRRKNDGGRSGVDGRVFGEAGACPSTYPEMECDHIIRSRCHSVVVSGLCRGISAATVD